MPCGIVVSLRSHCCVVLAASDDVDLLALNDDAYKLLGIREIGFAVALDKSGKCCLDSLEVLFV